MRNRTADLLLTMETLYRLSYWGLVALWQRGKPYTGSGDAHNPGRPGSRLSGDPRPPGSLSAPTGLAGSRSGPPGTQKSPAPEVRGFPGKIVRRRPTLPQGPPCSTIGAERLSFRVRNVTGRFPNAMTTETLSATPQCGDRHLANKHTFQLSSETVQPARLFVAWEQHSGREQLRTSPRPISTSQLHPLPGFHIWPINPVVYWEP